MSIFSNSMNARSRAFLNKGRIMSLLAFPLLLAIVFVFGYFVYPTLSPITQNTIDNGGLGMALGFIGAAVLYISFEAFWQSAVELWRSKPL